MTRALAETDLAAPVIAWLEEQRWDVYQEVAGPSGGVADIVATLGNLVCVVELKTSLSFEVVAQAKRWRSYASWTFVAVPHAKGSDGRALAQDLLESLGIGLITIDARSRGVDQLPWANIVHVPRLQRRIESSLRDALRPQHKTFARAGNAEGRHWTPFQDTCEKIARFVREHPGSVIKDVLGAIEHHYHTESTARACLVQWGERGSIRGVTLRREGRRLFFDPDPAAAPCSRCGTTMALDDARNQPDVCGMCRGSMAVWMRRPRVQRAEAQS
jgi:hypothetical protein